MRVWWESVVVHFGSVVDTSTLRERAVAVSAFRGYEYCLLNVQLIPTAFYHNEARPHIAPMSFACYGGALGAADTWRFGAGAATSRQHVPVYSHVC